MGAADGFGILALASVPPIVAVLLLGLIVTHTAKEPVAAPREQDDDLSWLDDWLDEELARRRAAEGARLGVS